ncbi:hypothetical protein [Microvirga sp. P5_D2]
MIRLLTRVVSGILLVAAQRLMLHPLLHRLVHASQRPVYLSTIGNIAGRELVLAEPTDQIGSELELSQPDFEQLPAVRTGQIDPYTPMILEQATASG